VIKRIEKAIRAICLWIVWRLAFLQFLSALILLITVSLISGGWCGSLFGWGFYVDLKLLAGLHRDCERDGFEAGDEIEGAFLWDGCEALRGGGADGEGAFWFGDVDGFGVGLGDLFG
jgi:hypothetical protein